VRVGFRTIALLTLCAAAAAAAMAHTAIDVIGDYALAHDTYDNLSHGSRELVTGAALLLALLLAAHGLRVCCAIATANRARIPQPPPGRRASVAFVLAVIAVTAVLVPAMEWLDGQLCGVPVKELDDAFGGSILLGLGTTVACAAFVALLVYCAARWLISHRDSIATMIETLLRRQDGALRPCRHDLARCLSTPRRRRTPHALRLCKRGPPGYDLPVVHL
jgi:hypothetical protein